MNTKLGTTVDATLATTLGTTLVLLHTYDRISTVREYINTMDENPLYLILLSHVITDYFSSTAGKSDELAVPLSKLIADFTALLTTYELKFRYPPHSSVLGTDLLRKLIGSSGLDSIVRLEDANPTTVYFKTSSEKAIPAITKVIALASLEHGKWIATELDSLRTAHQEALEKEHNKAVADAQTAETLVSIKVSPSQTPAPQGGLFKQLQDAETHSSLPGTTLASKPLEGTPMAEDDSKLTDIDVSIVFDETEGTPCAPEVKSEQGSPETVVADQAGEPLPVSSVSLQIQAVDVPLDATPALEVSEPLPEPAEVKPEETVEEAIEEAVKEKIQPAQPEKVPELSAPEASAPEASLAEVLPEDTQPPMEEPPSKAVETTAESEAVPEASPQDLEPLDRPDLRDASETAPSLRKRSVSPLAPSLKYKRFQNIAINLIKTIEEHRFLSPFLMPVNADDYHEVVKEPKDLKSILKAVKQKELNLAYQTVKELERDIMLMFANCVMFNKSSTRLVEMAREMKNDVRRTFKMFEDAESDIK